VSTAHCTTLPGEVSLEYEADITLPTNPTDAIETHGVFYDIRQNTCNDPAFTWSGADDPGGSGVAGYEVYWGTVIDDTTPAIWFVDRWRG